MSLDVPKKSSTIHTRAPSAAVPKLRSSNEGLFERPEPLPPPPKTDLKKPIVLYTTTLVHCTNTFNENLPRDLHVGYIRTWVAGPGQPCSYYSRTAS